MLKLRQILRFYSQGISKKQIAELTGVARNTVKRYIGRFAALKITYEDIADLSDHDLEKLFTEPHPRLPDERFEHLQQLLPGLEKQMSRKGVTLLSLWQQYYAANTPAYQYTQFRKYYHFYNKRLRPSMHIEHKAGDKMYIDFAGEKLSFIEADSGELKQVEVFVAILGYSQLTYVEAVMSQRKEDLIMACCNALHYFGGVPLAIVPDNLKAAVTKSSKYEPLINEAFADFAEHYGTAVLPARAYRPKDKSLVEGAVKIIYQRIYNQLRPQQYYSLQSLNEAIIQALEQHNNSNFSGRDYSRRDLFEELEKQALHPLPAYRYECKQQQLATVMKNGHVCLSTDKHYYSVPFRFIGKKVKLLYSSGQLEVYYKYERIAVHQRQYRKYYYTTLEEHLASAHRYLSEWTPQKFIDEAAAIGEEVARYITAVIEHKQHPEQAYKSCAGILSLKRKVGQQRLRNACKRATSFGIYNYPIIVQILDKQLDRLNEDETDQGPMPSHHNIRGEDYYQ